MQPELTTLSKLFLTNKSPEKPSFFYQKKNISWQELLSQIAFFSDNLSKLKAQNWLIHCEDTFLFTVAFFAAILAKKTIILPHNIQEKTLEGLQNLAQGVISDLENINTSLQFLKIDFTENCLVNPIHIDEAAIKSAKIIFLTSGSSSTPKQVTKTLMQLEEEVAKLDNLWGKNIKDGVFLATVSHQHIYGFLFRLLWPLTRGNLIYSSLVKTQESLSQLTAHFSNPVVISSPAFLKRITENYCQGTNIKAIFSSGGVLKQEFAQNVSNILRKFPIEVFGSTETGGVAWRIQDKNNIWRVFSKISIKVDLENALMVSLNNKEFFKMSDSAQILDESHFLLHERLDRIIKIEEKRVSLDDIENNLLRHEYVDSCYALALENQRQIIGVLVKLTKNGKNFLHLSDKTDLNKVLKKHLLQYLEPIVVPRKWRYVDEIPINSQGKIIINEIIPYFYAKSAN